MRNLRRLAWAAVAVAAAASPAAAQMGGGNAGGNAGTFTGGNLGTTLTNPTGGNTGTLNTAGTSGSSLGSSNPSSTTPALTAVEKAPQILAPSAYAASTTGGVLQSSNFLGPSFANPYYSGILARTRTGTSNPGGFGALTFGAATGGAGSAGGVTAGVQGLGGQRGGTGSVLNTDPGQVVALPRQIAYTAQLKFAPTPVAAPRLQADLRGVIDRAGLTVPAGNVQVQVDGTAVVLRGAVRDGDEARLVEGLVRLTPGVGRITNELNYPRP